ncbi:AraC family transcriptional regulator SphR [Maricurvus nonylphenolicus]|uniref:AraC family transcriptional regulator n=1 Tax=Maricurvus nonylphenolicus TaxID=1008307 RepID=UPI0036F278DE
MAIDTRCIPTYMFHVVQKVLQEFGIAPQVMVENSGISLEELSQKDTLMSFQQAMVLIDNALQASSEPGIGLRVAGQMTINDWGLFGYAVASCQSMEESLRVGMRYSAAATRLTKNDLVFSDGSFSLQSESLYPVGEQLPFLIEEDLGGIVQFVKTYADETLLPREVQLAYDAPSYIDLYEKHFQCPVIFGCEHNQLIWDEAVMKRPFPAHNPVAAQYALKLCEEFIQENKDGHEIVDTVRNILVQATNPFPAIEEVAKQLNMSESTLRRALKKEGSSYREILDSVKEKMAKEYLSTTNLRLEDIAYLVGFSDVSNFRRAFKKWTGKPPLFYRK